MAANERHFPHEAAGRQLLSAERTPLRTVGTTPPMARRPSAFGNAKRRRIPRLRARSIGVCWTSRLPALPPFRVWYGVNVHPACPVVNTLFIFCALVDIGAVC